MKELCKENREKESKLADRFNESLPPDLSEAYQTDWEAKFNKSQERVSLLEEENNGLKVALEAELFSGKEFSVLLDLLMVVNPWPKQVNRNVIKNMANDEAIRLGYWDWIDAYHNFERE